MRSSSLRVYSPVEYTGYKEKRSGHPSEPGSRTGNRKTTRKPKPILYRLRRFCKRLNWKGIGGLAVTTVVIVFAVRGVVGMFSEHAQTKTATITTSSPAAEESQPYVFYYKDGQAVSWEDVTDAWAAEAGIQKRYALTDAERLEIVWVYEADLTIRWTNADNPDETLEVTLHAIGTNDGGPDKAKGSAWTYCLKYYLFEKFGIDQGDDDPDMSDHSSEPPQQSQKQHTGAQNGNRQGNTQPQAQNGQTGRSGAARPLSDAQLSRLYRKGEDAGYSQQSINEWILKKYGQQDPHNLTRAQYDEACAAMDNAKQQGGQDNA